MNTASKTLLAFAFSVGIATGCSETNSPESDDGAKNLCKEYETCDECIAGEQKLGVDEGTAQTKCAAAVVGCWTTWKKPITCQGKEMTNDSKGN